MIVSFDFDFALGDKELFLSVKQASGTTTDNSCESVVMSGQPQQQQNPNPQHPNRDANNPAGSVYLTLCFIFRYFLFYLTLGFNIEIAFMKCLA